MTMELSTGARHLMVETLADQLMLISEIDPSNPTASREWLKLTDAERYERRNVAVVMAVGSALVLGFPAGYAVDPVEADGWIVAYIQLPTGQVSWHLPAFAVPWDLHSTPDKYTRCQAFIDRSQGEKF